MTVSNSPDHPEIHISTERLQKMGWVLLGLAVLFTIIGAIASPLDEQGRPILLLPEVKAVEDYRQLAHGWLSEMTVVEQEIADCMTTEQNVDLFSQSRDAQRTLQRAVKLAQQVERAKVPPIGMENHEQMLSTAMSYLEAARSMLQWVSTPEEENWEAAVGKLAEARQMKSEMENHSWLTSR